LLLEQAKANRAQAARNYAVAKVRLALLKDLPLQAGGTTGGASTAGAGGAIQQQQQQQQTQQQQFRANTGTQAAPGAGAPTGASAMNQRTHIARSAGLTFAAAAALGGLLACKGTETAKSATTPNAMIVGPENIAVVKAEQIRSGPAISGTLQPEQQATVRAEVGGTVLQAVVEQGTRVNKGQLLAASTTPRFARRSFPRVPPSRRRRVRWISTSVRSSATKRCSRPARSPSVTSRSRATNTRRPKHSSRTRSAARQRHEAAQQVHDRIAFLGHRQRAHGQRGRRRASRRRALHDRESVVDALEASVPADQLSAVRFGIPVDFTVSGYPTRHFTGRIANINPVADPATRQVRIIVSLPNENGVLVGGLFADGHVASEVRSAPVLPIAAVDERGLRPFVMRIKNGVVQKSEVELGIRDGATETVEIRSGVQAGDTILLGAARGISEKTPIKVSAVAADTARKL
jgi:multidrug efflux pump subunit AcrA (membrane-fusion protein)